MNDETKPRSYLLEGTLELGRNWALGLAIASAGTIAYRTETIDGPPDWGQYVFWGCILASAAWVLLAVLRFDEGLSRKYVGMGRVVHAAGVTLYGLLIAVGIGLVLLVGKFSDNNHIVKLCDAAATRPNSRILEYAECKRLQQQRQALFDRLEQGPKSETADE